MWAGMNTGSPAIGLGTGSWCRWLSGRKLDHELLVSRSGVRILIRLRCKPLEPLMGLSADQDFQVVRDDHSVIDTVIVPVKQYRFFALLSPVSSNEKLSKNESGQTSDVCVKVTVWADPAGSGQSRGTIGMAYWLVQDSV